MNRYSDIIEDIDIIHELEKRGIEGRIVGNNFMLNCVFHSEKNPSFGINIKNGDRKGLYQCFGCHVSGNFFHLISFIDDITLKTH